MFYLILLGCFLYFFTGLMANILIIGSLLKYFFENDDEDGEVETKKQLKE